MNSKVPRPGLRRGSSAPPRKAKSAPPSMRDRVGNQGDAPNSELPATRTPAELAELSDPFAEPPAGSHNPFAELAKSSDPFAEPLADPFADPTADAFDPFAESAEAAANQFKLPAPGEPSVEEDDEFGGMPPTARAPVGLAVDMLDTDIQIEISEDDEEIVEEEAPDSPPVSSRSPFGQSYLRARGEAHDAERPTVRAPATYPDADLLDQLAKTDDEKDDEE